MVKKAMKVMKAKKGAQPVVDKEPETQVSVAAAAAGGTKKLKDPLKARISLMLNWANYQKDEAVKATPEDKKQAEMLLQNYEAYNGTRAGREAFVRQFEMTKSTKNFNWSKDLTFTQTKEKEEDEKVLGKYMTRIAEHCICICITH